MGSYATTTSLSELLPNFLSGNTTTSDTAGTSIFSHHIDRAESIVNMYVTARFVVPFTTIPPSIRTLTEDIACYYAIRGAYTQDGQNKNLYYPEYKQALETLKLIQEGEIQLTLTDGSAVPMRDTQRLLSSSENYTPIFGHDDPSQWKLDPDEIDDMSEAREG